VPLAPAGRWAKDIDADAALAIFILLGMVDSVQFHHIGGLESARAMWATLKRIHNAPSRHKLASLLRQFYRFNAGTKTIDIAASFLKAARVDIRNN
jgi:hypothetical protein